MMLHLYAAAGRPSCKKGFTLLELSVVLVIIALVTGMALQAGVSVVSTARLTATQQKMAAIDQALLQYRTVNGRLPCPGDLTLTTTAANFGYEAGSSTGSAIVVGTGACTGAGMLPQANFTGSGVTNTSATAAEGALPALTLGLPADFMVDGWGNRLRYAVDVSMTANGAFGNTPIGCTAGAITINDANNNARSTSSIYALLSHGANGHGAYTSNGSIVNAGSANVKELVNCHCSSTGATTTSTGVQTSNSATYVQASPSIDPSNALDNFDDIVSFKERWQLQTPWDRKGPCLYVYVIDSANSRVEKFDLNGNYLDAIGAGYHGAGGTIGSSGTGNGQFIFNTVNGNGIAVDASGNLWVSESWTGGSANYRIQEFTSSGAWIKTIPTAVVSGPGALAIDASNDVWVYNFSGGTTSIMELNNYTGAVMSSFGSTGTAVGQFQGFDTTFDRNGYLWFADGNNHRMQKCTTAGSCTAYTAGGVGLGSGQLETPWGIAVDSGNNIWIDDVYQNTQPVQQFSNSGGFITSPANIGNFGSPACTVGKHIAIDPNGNLWSADSTSQRVWKYNISTGTCVLQVGCQPLGTVCSSGAGAGQFNTPLDITVGR